MTPSSPTDHFISEYATAPKPSTGARSWAMLFAFVGGAFLAGYLGSLFTQVELDGWYLSLEKPWFNPPNWVFPLAWTFLFVAMAVAAWMVWRAPFTGPEKAFALKAYWAHFLINIGWSAVFFTLKSPLWGTIVALALFASVSWIALLFARIRPLAGLLMVPYAMWVGFATILTATIWALNA